MIDFFNRYEQSILVVLLVCLWALPVAHAGDGLVKESAGKDHVLDLDMAVETALANNTIIKEAMERYNAAVQEEKSARSDLLPKLSASYSYTNLKHQPYSIFSGNRIYVSSDEVYHWDIMAVQPIFTGFALTTRHTMAELGVDLREIEQKLARMDVTRQVKAAYYNCLLAEKFLGVADEALRNLKSHVSDATRFYDEGMIAYNDLLKSKVALANSVQNRARARSNVDMAVSSLNTLLRLDINKPTQVEDVGDVITAFFDLDELIDKALSQRPELHALGIAIKNADNAIRLARSQYYPSLSLIGMYTQTGDNLKADHNDYSNDRNTTIALEARWQFFEWGKTRFDAGRYAHEKLALIEKTRSVEDGISLEVKNAFLNLQVSRCNIATAKESLAQAQENYRLTNLQYQQQMTTSTEVLDARTFLSQAQTNYYSALYGYMISEAELERAVGKMPPDNLATR
ncbi:MAG TPA: TolC family protein [Desulfobacteraceae bacterium]|nr:TolC family protein [Desulfobacteraceae bacterium]